MFRPYTVEPRQESPCHPPATPLLFPVAGISAKSHVNQGHAATAKLKALYPLLPYKNPGICMARRGLTTQPSPQAILPPSLGHRPYQV